MNAKLAINLLKPEPVTLFRFLQNDVLWQKTVKAIPHKNWTVTKNHGVCALHFTEDNFITKSNDHEELQKLSRTSQTVKWIRLKITAVSDVFPLLPQYLSSNAPAAIQQHQPHLLLE